MTVKPSAQPTLVRTQHLPPRKVPGHGRCAESIGLRGADGAVNRRLSLGWCYPSTCPHLVIQLLTSGYVV